MSRLLIIQRVMIKRFLSCRRLPAGSAIHLKAHKLLNRKTSIHLSHTDSVQETRPVDTRQLRLSHLTACMQKGVVGTLRDRLMTTFREFQIRVDLGEIQICMALEEALANAFYHGNLELESSLKERDDNSFNRLAEERCQKAPYCDRLIHVTELATPFGLWWTINDQGKGFCVDRALKKAQNPDLLLASGRGLAMMKAFTDELVFNAAGNQVTLVFYHNRNRDVLELLQERQRGVEDSTSVQRENLSGF